MKRYGSAIYVIVVAVCMFIVDRTLKHMALAGATVGPASGGVRFELFPNPAIAFSIAFPKTLTLILVPVIMGFFIYAALHMARRHDLTRAALLFAVVVGAFSNYLDRVKLGYVVDYVSFGNWFPVFNVSDVAIVAALVLVVTLPVVDRTRQ